MGPFGSPLKPVDLSLEGVEENAKFQLGVSQNKDKIFFPIKVHELPEISGQA